MRRDLPILLTAMVLAAALGIAAASFYHPPVPPSAINSALGVITRPGKPLL